MKSRPRHFYALDFYRFVAAFGVLLLHLAQFSLYDTNSEFGNLTADFYLFVDFFFILSGFVVGITYFDRVGSISEIYTFLRRRIARIYPLHILTLLFYLAPAVVGLSTNAQKYCLSPILQQILLVQSWPLNASAPFNFPAWSISVEWAMYLLFPAVVWICRAIGMWSLIALIGLGLFGLETAMKFVQPPLWFADTSVIRAIPTFTVGILISRIYDIVPIRGGLTLGILSFIVAIIAMIFHFSPYIVLGLFLITIWTTAAGSGGAQRQIFDGIILRELGNASYAIYMIHSITLTAAIQYIWPRVSSAAPPIWFGLFVCIVTILLSIIIFHTFERPARDIISGRSLRLETGSV
jgi:peptidoglycan/LPS O-acetylase OafA/YrhL